MTLIAVYTSEGCVGRCDAKCYNAKLPECECVCGGRNHGVGLQKALDNTRELAEQMIEEYAKRLGLKEWQGIVPEDVMQMPLPLLPEPEVAA